MSSNERNQELYEKLSAGDKAARDALIEANAPLVRHIARDLCEKNEDLARLRDELISEGNLALVLAVDAIAIAAAPIENVTGHLAACINNAMTHCRDSEQSPGVHHATTRRKRAARRNARRRCLRGEGYCNTVNDCNHTEDCIRYAMRNGNGPRPQDDYRPDPETLHDVAIDEIAAPNHEAAADLRDMIATCCETDRERQVIELRSQGFKDDEIAERIGVSRQTVNLVRQKIEAAYDSKSLALSA